MNIIILLGCNGGANKQDSLQLQNQMVSLSSIGVIPIVDDNRHEIYLRLHNNDNQSVANITLVTSGDKPEQQFWRIYHLVVIWLLNLAVN